MSATLVVTVMGTVLDFATVVLPWFGSVQFRGSFAKL